MGIKSGWIILYNLGEVIQSWRVHRIMSFCLRFHSAKWNHCMVSIYGMMNIWYATIIWYNKAVAPPYFFVSFWKCLLNFLFEAEVLENLQWKFQFSYTHCTREQDLLSGYHSFLGGDFSGRTTSCIGELLSSIRQHISFSPTPWTQYNSFEVNILLNIMQEIRWEAKPNHTLVLQKLESHYVLFFSKDSKKQCLQTQHLR